MQKERVAQTPAELRREQQPLLYALHWYSASIAAPKRRLWALTAAIVIVDVVWLQVAGIAIATEGLMVIIAIVSMLVFAAIIFGRTQSEPSLRGMALASAFLVAFTMSIGVLHYLAASLRLPFIDISLAQWEAALGFDWQSYVGYLADHPRLSWWLALAYHSSGAQVGAVVVLLSATRQLGRLWAFLRLFTATMLCVVVLSALLPALGPYAHYMPNVVPTAHLETVGALWHLDPVTRLRNGTVDQLALSDIRGLATFPSFHVSLAILTAWALVPLPVLGLLALLLNTAVVIGTISAGGHYLPDVLAGAAIAFAALAYQAAVGHSQPRVWAPNAQQKPSTISY